ncbi:1921_t:CDS:1 [Dentiscutata erythropus]|uniref:1921_t:CDS:1 n=1 Tax=Dentiscutata erythropus TaxID=1348616 RepID=A0A9N8ZU02_9GLOM|nr:1921_t:CDS:1 [Dentiscutata erythropus]
MTNERTILLVGRTGNGRSTIANVISNTNKFKESEYAVSESEGGQIEHFRIRGENMIYHIIDTIGIGDNRFTGEETLHRLANAIKGVQNGLNQIFFVISGKFTQEDVEAFTLFRTVFFGEDIGKYTTIIQTKFPGFRDPEKRRKNKEVMRNQNENVATILNSCRRLVHVNNLTEQEDSRQRARNDCRAFLRNYLSSNCQNVYIPSNLGEMDERIQNYLAEKSHGDGEQIQINQLMKENQHLREQLNNFIAQQNLKNLQNFPFQGFPGRF